jgi:outer membrane protein assembly factor BamB
VTIELEKSMLQSEEAILNAVNEVGTLATGKAIEQFDTDGSPIQKDSETWTSFGAESKTYQTPYGIVAVSRHVYQSSKGGRIYCPLEDSARIIVTSTPQFARIVSSKYANMPSTQVQRDLCDISGRRSIARSYLQNISEAVGCVAQEKEEVWHYVLPKLEEPVETVTIGVDGTCMLLCTDGYREAMVGTISLYDKQGKRQHTTYLGATPE